MLLKITGNTFNALLDAEAASFASHCVGFVLTRVENNEEECGLGGSGTLTSIDGLQGVLTAAHVVKELRKHNRAGLVMTAHPCTTVHRIIFETHHCADFSLAPSGNPVDGPDIAFLVLPPDTTASLKALRSFYNLTKRRDSYLNKAPPRDHGVWALSGLAEEWSKTAPPQPSFPRIKMFDGKVCPLDVIGSRNSGQWDYVTLRANYSDSADIPHSFGGYSGAGLWQILVKPGENGNPMIDQKHLLGVAYYESDLMAQPDTTVRDVSCHGRESIYRHLIDHVRDSRR